MVRVESTSICNVVKDVLGDKSKPEKKVFTSLQCDVMSVQRVQIWASRNTDLCAMSIRRSGLKVPSESMYNALPSPPPCDNGNWKRQCGRRLGYVLQTPARNKWIRTRKAGAFMLKTHTWHATARVWHNWVFPVLNSPYISVSEPVSIPPANNKNREKLRYGVARDAAKVNEVICKFVGTLQNGIQLLCSSRDLYNLPTKLMYMCRALEPHGHQLARWMNKKNGDT